MSDGIAFLVRLALFVVVGAICYWASTQTFDVLGNAICILSLVTIFPAVMLARFLVDRRPEPKYAAWITTFLHAWLLLCDAVGLIKAWQTAADWRLVVIPVPDAIGHVLMALTGIVAALAVVNLALRGFGAPVALWLSHKLSTDWLYKWTRNPMALATILCFFCIGLWLQSFGFVLWTLLLAAPAELFFIKYYEERELEIRFGEAYLEYKKKTPFLWPQVPQPQTPAKT